MSRREARMWVFVVLAATCAAVPSTPLAQVVGDNVNMVSGIGWPGGDPFLQRQNEPSIAVSSANPNHLLAGANDYRSIDIPVVAGATKMAADAWQGVFKSYDGGLTWKSYLMPGYPLDPFSPDRTGTETAPPYAGSSAMRAACGAGGPCLASADPIVRAGTNGMFYFGGITFARGTNFGAVVLNRFIDLNDKENGEPIAGKDSIQWVDAQIIDQSDGTYFADKPWIAVDVPRTLPSPGGPIAPQQCTITSPRRDASGNPTFQRTFVGGAVYVVWARIYTTVPETADVMFRRSLDCGKTWGPIVKMNDPNSRASQGAVVTVDPRTGYVYTAWRRFAFTSPTQSDAIMMARSFTKGNKFTHPQPYAIAPFDQGQADLRFRTEAFPTIAASVSADGKDSWTHVAWAERSPTTRMSRIMMTQAWVRPPPPDLNEDNDGNESWKIPATPIDTAPVKDDAGNAFNAGHQFMPQLAFSQGRLVAVYYDSRLDHTRTYHRPNLNCDASGANCTWGPSPTTGRWYVEERGGLGERGTRLDWWTDEIDDAGVTIRHTIDVRVAVATPSASPVFTSTTVSRMPFGERGDEASPDPRDPTRDPADACFRPLGFDPATGHVDLLGPIVSPGTCVAPPPAGQKVSLLRLQDLQANPPNLPLFKNGTRAFIGDYIDVQGPVFAQDANGSWIFNSAWTPSPVFHAVWTSNQDVVPPPLDPATGLPDWTKYTPVDLGRAGQASLSGSAGATVPLCDPLMTGSRNQNVYTARITDGLLVTTPQNAKVLDDKLRGFAVTAFNSTGQDRWFRFEASAPAGVVATFDYLGSALSTAPVRIPARSSATQTLFMQLGSGTNPATTYVTVREVTASGGTVPSPLTGSLVLNPPGVTWLLAQPEGAASTAGGETRVFEISAASLANASLVNASLVNASLQNASLVNASLQNASLQNYSVVNASLVNASLANASLANANLVNASLANASLQNASLVNASLANASLANASLQNASLVNASLQNASLQNASLQNASLANASLVNASLVNAPLTDSEITDINYTVTNTGNTSQGFDVRLLGVGSGDAVQLIVSKSYAKPIAFGCSLAELGDNQVLVNAGAVTAGGIFDGSTVTVLNGDPLASFAMAPGETIQVTLRGRLTADQARLLTTRLTPVVTAHGTPLVWTNAALFVKTAANQAGTVGSPVSIALATIGQKGSVSWQWSTDIGSGVAPTIPGVGLVNSGSAAAVSGVPTKAGTYDFFVQATDSYTGADGKTRTYDALKRITLTVAPGAPTITATATPASPAYGEDVTVAASLAPSGITGCVQFSEGATTRTVCDTDTGFAGFRATFPRPAAGLHRYAAAYLGDANWEGASTRVDVTVRKADSLTGLRADWPSITPLSPGPTYGEAVTLLATVSVDASATGCVQFKEGATPIGAPVCLDPLLSTHVASLTLPTPPPGGGHAYSATYSGDANWNGSTGTASVTVQKASTSVGLAASPGAPVYGQAIVLTATLTPAGPPTGTVELKRGATSYGTVAVGASGSVSWTVSDVLLAGGPYAFTATYSGDGNWAGSAGTASVDVGKATTTVTVGTAPTSSYGTGTTLSATVAAAAPGAGTPTGTVQFVDTASGGTAQNVGAPVTLTGGSASLTTQVLTGGAHSISAVYSGDANFSAPAASGSSSISVSPSASSALSITTFKGTFAYGEPLPIRVSVQPAFTGAVAATGNVDFQDRTLTTYRPIGTQSLSGNPGTADLSLALPDAGTYTFGAQYGGDGRNYGPGSAQAAPVVVLKAPVSVDAYLVDGAGTLLGGSFASPATMTYGDLVSLRAYPTWVPPGTATSIAVPDGDAVTFLDQDVTGPGSASVAGGSATIGPRTFPAGSHRFAARHEPSANHALGTSNDVYVDVRKASTAAEVNTSKTPSAVGESVTLTCTVTSFAGATPSGTVQFLDGTTVVAPTATQAVTPTGAGTWTARVAFSTSGDHPIACAYLGDSNFLASGQSKAITQTVSPVGTSTSVKASPNPVTYGSSFTLTATVTSSVSTGQAFAGTVTFSSGGATVGTAPVSSTGVATLTVPTVDKFKVGTYTFAAQFASASAAYASSGTTTTASLTVVSPWTFTGFLSPLKTAGSLQSPTYSGVQKLGSGVPVKWQITDPVTKAFVGDLSTLTVMYALPNASATCTGAPDPNGTRISLYVDPSGATGGSTFRYGSNTYIFTWDTTKGVPSVGCYTVVLVLRDGTIKATNLKLQ